MIPQSFCDSQGETCLTIAARAGKRHQAWLWHYKQFLQSLNLAVPPDEGGPLMR
jgi:hypothetical protein